MRGTKTSCQEREVTTDWAGEGEKVEFLDGNVLKR